MGSGNVNGAMEQYWKPTSNLNLQGNLQIDWDKYVMDLNHCGFQLTLDDYYLAWSWNEENGELTAKLAYDAILFTLLNTQRNWWHFSYWKWHIPLMIKLFCWLMLENKILTWDNYVKRGGVGPIICVLCHLDVESVDHLMIHCPFS